MNHLINVLLLNMDGVPDTSGDFFTENSHISWTTPCVPILDRSHGSAIGEARINKVGTKLYADLSFFTAYLAEEVLELVPTFDGVCLQRFLAEVTEAKLNYVTLAYQNADRRIPRLKHYTFPVEINFEIKADKNECRCPSLIHGHHEGCSWRKN